MEVGARQGAELRDDLAYALKVRVDGQRNLEGGAGFGHAAVPKADLAKAGDRPEMAGFQKQGLLDIDQRLGIALFDEGEDAPLVPGLGPVGGLRSRPRPTRRGTPG